MANSVYKINKGVNQPVEFKGLKAQYIWYLGGGLLVLLILFAVMYLIGLNTYVALFIIISAGSLLFVWVNRLSRKYGEFGMMKKAAGKAVPTVIKCFSRKIKGLFNQAEQ